MHAENIQSLSGFTIEEAHKMLCLKHVKQSYKLETPAIIKEKC